jgi:hypothetical protein
MNTDNPIWSVNYILWERKECRKVKKEAKLLEGGIQGSFYYLIHTCMHGLEQQIHFSGACLIEWENHALNDKEYNRKNRKTLSLYLALPMYHQFDIHVESVESKKFGPFKLTHLSK